MDRAMGSRGAIFVNSYGYGWIGYEYGRKDPLPGNVTIYNINGSALTATAPANFAAQKWTTGANSIAKPAGVVIPTSVKNPLVNYTGTDWSGLNENAYIWQDSKVAKTNLLEKSIYDPCPPGWMAPQNTAFQDWRAETVNNAARGLAWSFGGLYYPYVNEGGVYPVYGRIFLPAHGYRLDSTGTLVNNNECASVWCASSNSTDGALRPDVHNGSIGYSSSNNKAYNWGVRCVSMPPQP